MSHFQVFFEWLFDGNIKSKIPKPKYDSDGKEIVPNILKYNSPITNIYMIKIFMNDIKLNYYLNSVMNNINLWYLDKEDLLYFIKKCVIDFGVRRNSILYIKHEREEKLFSELRRRIKLVKNNEINLLCDIIKESDNKEVIYNSLGISKPLKKKVKKKSKKNNSLKNFLKNNFKVVEVGRN